MTLQELIQRLQSFIDTGVPPETPMTITYEENEGFHNVYHNIDCIYDVISDIDSIRIVC